MAEPDRSFVDVVSMAQTLISAERERLGVTPAVIADKVKLAAQVLAGAYPDGVDEEAAVAELIRRFSQWIGKDASLHDGEGHTKWLDAARKRDWRYWQRYQTYLERKLPLKIVAGLDASTDGILGQLEDPTRTGAWDRRGLVVGHVQSGKTGNYSGLICKAADAGYKVIVVLAGLHNNLRSQTQIRLEEAFLGYETTEHASPRRVIGVGAIDSDPEISPNCATTRQDRGDFSTKVAQHVSVSPEKRPWLFVVKKNKSVLSLLLKWIQERVADATDSATGRRFVSNVPLLVIDDEADHASVDTGEQLFKDDGTPDEEHEPKAINSLIRKILHSFARKAYVGYTATPFANIFIHRLGSTAEEGPDLFPQAFIINLAAPSEYVGPTRVFGTRSSTGREGGLPLVRDISDQADPQDERLGWMPVKHTKKHVPVYNGEPQVPPSLEEAVQSFVLACAARVCRGQGREHSSMLVHVTRFTDVQDIVHQQVEDLVDRMRQRVARRNDHETLLEQLRGRWLADFVPTSRAINGDEAAGSEARVPEWTEIAEHLADVLSDIEVRKINGTAKDALDYADGGRPLKVIAIGGDKLARGLTLEGLCVSYFVRTTKMYDTLMQMGRWFGYRPGYVDLCRLYTTAELVEWFGHIADASQELRDEFDAMVERGATPKDYGLRVQSHPVLLVTSPLKMRTAKPLQLSFSGELLETVAFHIDSTTLDRNLRATSRLLSSLPGPDEVNPERTRGGSSRQKWKGYTWSRVDWTLVAEFFDGYVTHPASRKVVTPLLSEFVRSMARKGELTSWTVALLGGGQGEPHTFASGLTVDMVQRKADGPPERYSIGRLLSPRDEGIDLDAAAWAAALDVTQRAWRRQRPEGDASAPPSEPSGPAYRQVRGMGADGVPAAPHRGLLLIYPLDPSQARQLGSRTDPVMGFGVSFPSSDSGVKVQYQADHLYFAQEYGQAD